MFNLYTSCNFHMWEGRIYLKLSSISKIWCISVFCWTSSATLGQLGSEGGARTCTRLAVGASCVCANGTKHNAVTSMQGKRKLGSPRIQGHMQSLKDILHGRQTVNGEAARPCVPGLDFPAQPLMQTVEWVEPQSYKWRLNKKRVLTWTTFTSTKFEKSGHRRFAVYQEASGSYCCSAAQPCPTLCNPMDCSTPGFTKG